MEWGITFIYSTAEKRDFGFMQLTANSAEEAQETFTALMREGYAIVNVKEG